MTQPAPGAAPAPAAPGAPGPVAPSGPGPASAASAGPVGPGRGTGAPAGLVVPPGPGVHPLGVDGAWAYTPVQHADGRGVFLEAFSAARFAGAAGHPFALAQANTSVSRLGVVRGVHFADVPPGQAKYVTCPSGAVVDVVVDLRVGSPGFGEWAAVRLDDVDRRALYLPEGVGHAFVAVSEVAVVSYLCSTPYAPGREHGVDPLDPALGLPFAAWLPPGVDPVLSDKDRAAPSLARAIADGLLPTAAACTAWVDGLRAQA